MADDAKVRRHLAPGQQQGDTASIAFYVPGSMDVFAWAAYVRHRWQRVVPLVVGLAAVIWMWLAYPHNYEMSDPSQYSRYAVLVSNGSYLDGRPPNIFGHRLGTVVPVGISYALFGVTPHTTDLVPLLAALTILVVVWSVLPGAAAIPGVVSVVTCVPVLRATTELFPDLIATAFLMVSTFALSRRLGAVQARGRQVALAGFGVLTWFCAVLAKETAWWALPLWAGALLVDAWRKRKGTLIWFHLPALLAGLVFCAAYLAFCGHFFGDALAHVHRVQELSGKHAWTIRGAENLKIRLTSGAALYFWKQYGVLLIPAALGLLVLPPSLRIWGFYTALTTLLYWFGSASLTSYQPLPTMPRMSLPCAPGFCICAAYFLYFLSQRLPRIVGGTRAVLLFSLLGGLALAPRVRDFTESWRSYSDLDAMAELKREFKEHPTTQYLLISAEKRSDDYVSLYFGFAPPANVNASYAGTVDRAAIDRAQTVLLFVERRHKARGKDFARQFRALRLPTFFQHGDATVFVAEDHARIAALLTPRG